MTENNAKKYRIESVLHEYIRDLPEVKKIVHAWNIGLLTFDEALKEIARAILEERERENA